MATKLGAHRFKGCIENSERFGYLPNLVCRGSDIFVKGSLVQMSQPYIFRSSMESVANALEAIVLCVQNGKDFRVSSIDHSALTILYVALWMYKNHGRNDVPAMRWNP